MSHQEQYCTQCGGEISPDDTYCSSCGTAVNQRENESSTSGQGINSNHFSLADYNIEDNSTIAGVVGVLSGLLMTISILFSWGGNLSGRVFGGLFLGLGTLTLSSYMLARKHDLFTFERQEDYNLQVFLLISGVFSVMILYGAYGFHEGSLPTGGSLFYFATWLTVIYCISHYVLVVIIAGHVLVSNVD